MTTNRTYKVIQWATGGVGAEALKGILMHPQLELVGVKAYSDDKSGKDAGELCGMSPTGVRATSSFEEILATEADCVSYMPNLSSLDEVCELLRSGKNVACSPFLFYANNLPDSERKQLAAACEEGKSSVHGTGIHPGFAGMVLPLAMSGLSRTIDKVLIQERADWSFYDRPQITFDNMRFGSPPDKVSMAKVPFLAFNARIFSDQVRMLADAFGVPLDALDIEEEVLAADDSYDIICGRIEKGTVNAQRYTIRGIVKGEPRLEIQLLWTVGGQYPGQWQAPADGWTVTIEGNPSIQLHGMTLASYENAGHCSIADHVHASEIATAMQVVNSIPALCEAEPGIRGTFELGGVYSGTGMRHLLP
jgi:hypothetical protein